MWSLRIFEELGLLVMVEPVPDRLVLRLSAGTSGKNLADSRLLQELNRRAGE